MNTVGPFTATCEITHLFSNVDAKNGSSKPRTASGPSTGPIGMLVYTIVVGDVGQRGVVVELLHRGHEALDHSAGILVVTHLVLLGSL